MVSHKNQPFGYGSSQLTGFFVVPQKAYLYNIGTANSKKHLFHNISIKYHANLTKQGLP